MTHPVPITRYHSFRDLPMLAGLATVAEAARPGLSVEACVGRLKREHYAFKRLHEIFTARITAEPIYELKTGFSHHAYLCAEHVTAFRQRVGEMREPPLGLDVVPDLALEQVFDEILAAPVDRGAARWRLRGRTARAGRGPGAAQGRHQPADRRTVAPDRRFARLEIDDMLQFGRPASRNSSTMRRGSRSRSGSTFCTRP